MPVQCICPICGTPFLTRPYVLRRVAVPCCKRACQTLAARRGEDRYCGICERRFYVPQNQIRKGGGLYCSDACNTESQRGKPSVLCRQCGVSFVRPRPGQALCSPACAIAFRQLANHWNWKGGIKKRDHQGKEYAAWRMAIFERDGFTCRLCGDARGGLIRAHHIRFWSAYPDARFDLDNGLTLCESCHRRTHAEAKRRGVDAWPVS